MARRAAAAVTEAGRPQDQGRPHRRRSSPASGALLTDWYAALRLELRAVVDELHPKPTGQTRLDGQADVKAPTIARRRELVELGAKIVAALGSEVDERPTDQGPARRRRGPVKVDFGGS